MFVESLFSIMNFVRIGPEIIFIGTIGRLVQRVDILITCGV